MTIAQRYVTLYNIDYYHPLIKLRYINDTFTCNIAFATLL